jgi:hypothetical protein
MVGLAINHLSKGSQNAGHTCERPLYVNEPFDFVIPSCHPCACRVMLAQRDADSLHKICPDLSAAARSLRASCMASIATGDGVVVCVTGCCLLIGKHAGFRKTESPGLANDSTQQPAVCIASLHLTAAAAAAPVVVVLLGLRFWSSTRMNRHRATVARTIHSMHHRSKIRMSTYILLAGACLCGEVWHDLFYLCI